MKSERIPDFAYRPQHIMHPDDGVDYSTAKRAPEHKSVWQLQAEKWEAPHREFKCCGTIFRAMTPATLILMKAAHSAAHA